MSEFESMRCVWEVVAGLVPGRPESEFTRRWVITSAEWEALNQRADLTPDHPDNLFTRYPREAYQYAQDLTDPRRFNWVRCDFIWL